MNHCKLQSTTEIALKLLFLGFDITHPEDFGAGLAKDGASLFKKTYGFSDTLSKFTGSISKGLSVVTRRLQNIPGKTNFPLLMIFSRFLYRLGHSKTLRQPL